MSENQEKAKKLSTEPYKGVRDFYPADMAIQNYIFGIWKKTAESFGYEEYGASVLEPADLYKAKSGDEIVNEQTYTFTDRGEREVTLRPEMTPTVARMVSLRRRELVFPLRWYSIPNLFRYEQPQRGRVREHWQLNVDLFGTDSIEADIEIISLAYHVMKDFGAKDSDFEIRVNNLQLLDDLLTKKYGISDENLKRAISKALDKKNKIPDAVFKDELGKAISKEAVENFVKELDLDIEPFEASVKTENPNSSLIALKNKLQGLGIKIIFDPSIVRGFDYYTGMVFEIYDTSPENRRALFGGGRYDNLTSLFGGDKVPAVGFGMGDVGIRNFLETRDLLPKSKAPADYYICVMSQGESAFAERTAQELRDNPPDGGSRVAIDFTYKKIGEQIKSADKRGIPNVIVIGAEEAKSGKVKVKNLATGEEKDL